MTSQELKLHKVELSEEQIKTWSEWNKSSDSIPLKGHQVQKIDKWLGKEPGPAKSTDHVNLTREQIRQIDAWLGPALVEGRMGALSNYIQDQTIKLNLAMSKLKAQRYNKKQERLSRYLNLEDMHIGAHVNHMFGSSSNRVEERVKELIDREPLTNEHEQKDALFGSLHHRAKETSDKSSMLLLSQRQTDISIKALKSELILSLDRLKLSTVPDMENVTKLVDQLSRKSALLHSEIEKLKVLSDEVHTKVHTIMSNANREQLAIGSKAKSVSYDSDSDDSVVDDSSSGDEDYSDDE